MSTDMQQQRSHTCTGPQASSTWGTSPIGCWPPRSTSLPSWPTLTPASPTTQPWGTRTTVSGSSADKVRGCLGSSWLTFWPPHPGVSRSGNLFVVQWDNVHLKDREADGPFTFQAVLDRNGTIVFNYRDVSYGRFFSGCSSSSVTLFQQLEADADVVFFQIPIAVESMNSTEHPVKVGLSDAFLARLPSSQPSGDFKVSFCHFDGDNLRFSSFICVAKNQTHKAKETQWQQNTSSSQEMSHMTWYN